MYAAVGALTPQVAQAARAAMPPCYNQTFDDCLDDANRGKPGCERYEPLHVGYDQDHDETYAMVEQLPYCEYGRDKMILAAGIGAGVGLLVGFAIGAAAG